MTQDNFPKVYAAINAVTAELSKHGIGKDRNNAQQGYKFRGIDDIYNALSSALSANKLSIIPRVVSNDIVERTSKSGGILFCTTLIMEFDLVCSLDGSMHTARMIGEAMDSADKSSNKAMSAAYKYLALQLFCIPTEGDNDADAQTHEVQPGTAKTVAKTDKPSPGPIGATPVFLNKAQVSDLENLLLKVVGGDDAAYLAAAEAILKHVGVQTWQEVPAARYKSIRANIVKRITDAGGQVEG